MGLYGIRNDLDAWGAPVAPDEAALPAGSRRAFLAGPVSCRRRTAFLRILRRFHSGIHASVGAVTSIGAIGYIFWTLRGGVLVAAALSQLPSWRMIDPLPVLENYAAENRKDDDDIVGNFFT